MVSQKDMENIIIKKKLYIMDIGSMIYSMALDMKYGLNRQNIMGIIMMGKNMEQVHIFGPIKLNMKENGKMILEKDMEFILLKMEMFIKENLEIII